MGAKSKEKINLTQHQKIAENRGSKWRERLVAGRIEAQLNPSVMKIARLRARIDQASFAEKLAIEPSTYGAIERGKQRVRPSRAKAIAKLLRMPIDKLFEQTKCKNSPKPKYIAIVRKQQL